MERREVLKALLAGAIACGAPPAAASAGSSSRINATYYVDAEAGSDAASGKRPGTAWRSFQHLRDRQFFPGDRILLRRGRIWSEPLRPIGSGTAGAPITIGTYGEGPRPVIDAGGVAPALALVDQEGWIIHDLVLTSPGQTGLLLDSTLRRRSFFRLRDLEVHHARHGIEIGRHKDGADFNGGHLDDVILEGCVVHDIAHRGIVAAGNYGDPALPRNRNVRVALCLVYNCGWDGIVVTSTSRALVSDCVAHDCGWATDGRYGIWAWWADHVVIQDCETSGIRTTGTKDGGGFDLDFGTSDCVIQYCYAHDCDGPGFAVIGSRRGPSHPPRRNVLRYNVSLANCRKVSAEPHGEITLFGGMDDILVYNNTLHADQRARRFAALTMSGWIASQTGWPSATRIRNTIIYAEDGCRALWTDAESTREERVNTLDYDVYHTTGRTLSIQWGRQGYPSLETFAHETGQERHGRATDPRLRRPGTIDVGRLPLPSYQLQHNSPCIDQGVRLSGHSPRDYWGNPVPTGSAPDIGAHEFTRG